MIELLENSATIIVKMRVGDDMAMGQDEPTIVMDNHQQNCRENNNG